MTPQEFLNSKGVITDAHVFRADEIRQWLTEYSQVKAIECNTKIRGIYTGDIDAGFVKEQAEDILSEIFGIE